MEKLNQNYLAQKNNLDEFHFGGFQKIKYQKNSAALMTQFPISITLNYFIFLPSKTKLVLDEIHYEWFKRIKHQRYFTAAMTQFPISISLNNFTVEPLKMDLVLAENF